MKNGYVDITYMTRAFTRGTEPHEMTVRACGQISFKDGKVYFNSTGRGFMINVEQVVRIETVEE